MFSQGVIEFYGLRNMTIFAREIVAKEGSKIKVITPGWIQNFPDTPRKNYARNGKDGIKGNDGEAGPNGRKTILISREKNGFD